MTLVKIHEQSNPKEYLNYLLKIKYPSFSLPESKVFDFAKISRLKKKSLSHKSPTKTLADLRQTYDTEILSSMHQGPNNNSIRVYKQESQYNEDFYLVFKDVEKQLIRKNNVSTAEAERNSKITYCKFTSSNQSQGKSFERKTQSKTHVFKSDEWTSFLSKHGLPFYDEEFPDDLVSVFGYFELEAIKEKVSGKRPTNRKKMRKNQSKNYELSKPKLDERFNFLLEKCQFGFQWERPNISEASFTPNDDILGLRGAMWRQSGNRSSMKEEFSIVNNFNGEGGRVLQLFGKGSQPDWREIRQGSLLDDWFLASLISLSRNPERIMKIVLQPLMNAQEVLGFCFNSVGIWAILDVDESLPFYKCFPEGYENDLNRPLKTEELLRTLETRNLGAYSSQNNLWVSYFEKAYAKLNEGYFNISNNGKARHALTDMTSAPSRTFELANMLNSDKLKELVQFYQAKKFPMTAKTVKNSKALSSNIEKVGNFLKRNPGLEDKFMFSQFGLFPDYEYALFGIKTKLIELKEIGKIKCHFVELRCTHGPGYHWKGPCYYTDDEGNKINFKIPDPIDGNILIPVEEFMTIFENFTVCFYHDNYLSTAIRANEVPNSFISYEVKVRQRGEYYFRITQLSHYMVHPEKNLTKLVYDNLTLVVSHINDLNEPQFLAGCSQRARDIWVKLNLDIGTYLVFVSHILLKVNFDSSKQAKGNFVSSNRNYLGFNVYGVDNVRIQKRYHDRIENNKHFGSLLNKTISSIIYQKNEEAFITYPIESNGKQLMNLSYSYMPLSSVGFGCIILKNSSFNELYKVEFRDKEIGKFQIFAYSTFK